MYDMPVSFNFDLTTGSCSQKPTLRRYLANMRGMFADKALTESLLASGENPLLYEFYDMEVPENAADLAFGCSICHPGKIGQEYYMTKGHYHNVFDTAETYLCLRGHGLLLMENPAGDWSAQELTPGCMVYVPGGWAHRSINVGSEPFITFYTFRADAGHDYATIETTGFRKLVVEQAGTWQVIDNPQWEAMAR